MKICARCKIELSSENFNKSSKSKDGLFCYCKSCRAEDARERMSVPGAKDKQKENRWKREGYPKPKRIGYIEDGIGFIPLTKGQVSVVDPEDVKWLSKYQWYAFWNKCTTSFYAMTDDRGNDRRTIGMHRLLLGITDPDIDGEYKNHDSLDN